MQRIADRVYYKATYKHINVGFVETSAGVVLIDTPMLPSEAIAWRDEVSQYGPIKFALLTDHLQEHSTGAYFLDTDLIAHHTTHDKMRMTPKAKEHFRKRLSKADPRTEELLPENFHLPTPNLMLYDRLTIYLGDRELEFIHLPGHTSNNAGLYLPDARILFAGDTVTNGYRPYMGLSDIPTWITTLRAIQVMEVDLIVPGKGAPMEPQELDGLIRYLELTRERVQHFIDEGLSRNEVVSKMMSFFDEWPTPPEFRDEERNLYRQSIRRIYDFLVQSK